MTTPNVEWMRIISSSGTDFGNCVTTDASGYVYVGGNVGANPVIIGGSQYSGAVNEHNAFFAKMDASGNTLWYQQIDGGTSAGDNISDIVVDSANNIYVAGTVGFSNGIAINGINYSKTFTTSSGVYIAKMDQNRNVQWLNWIDCSGGDVVFSIYVDSAQNVYYTGTINTRTITIGGVLYCKPVADVNANGAITIKFNPAGVVQWVRFIDGVTTTSQDFGRGVVADSNGNVYVTGNAASAAINFQGGTIYSKPNNSSDIGAFLVKYDGTGTVQWVSFFDSSGTVSDFGYTCDLDSLGNVYVAVSGVNGNVSINGTRYFSFKNTSVGALIKLDPAGVTQWVKFIDQATTSIWNIHIRGNFLYYCASATVTTTLTYDQRIVQTVTNTSGSTTSRRFISCIDLNGVHQWAKFIESDNPTNVINAIFSDSTGNVYAMMSAYTNFLKADSQVYYIANVDAVLIKLGSLTPVATVPSVPQTVLAQSYGYRNAMVKFFHPQTNGGSPITHFLIKTYNNDLTTLIQTTQEPYVNNLSITNYIHEVQLMNVGVQYKFTVIAVNAVGQSVESAASNTVIVENQPYPAWTSIINTAFTGAIEPFNKMVYDTSGNLYTTFAGAQMTGITINGVPYNNVTGANVATSGIIRYNSSGNVDWILPIESSGGTIQCMGLKYMKAENCLIMTGFSSSPTFRMNVGGTFYSQITAQNNACGFVMKLNLSGNVLALKMIDSPTTGTDYAINADSDALGNIYVCGYTSSSGILIGSTTPFYSKPTTLAQGAYIVRFDSTLNNVDWVRWIDGSGTSPDLNYDIVCSVDGGLYVTGYVSHAVINIAGTVYSKINNSSDNGAFLVRLNSSGVVNWVKWIDGTSAERGYGLACDSNGNVLFAGTMSSTTVTIDGQVYSKTYSLTQTGNILVKFNPSGNVLWFNSIDSSGSDLVYAIAVDTNGNSYVGGNVGLGLATTSLLIPNYVNEWYIVNGTTTQSAFIAKFDSSGVYQWLKLLDSTGSDVVYGLAVSGSGKLACIYRPGASIANIDGLVYNTSGQMIIQFSEDYIVPTAPRNISVVKANQSARVSFDTPSNYGGYFITQYTVTASPGGATASGTSSPINVTGLTNGTTYTFSVTATNSLGVGTAAVSNPVLIGPNESLVATAPQNVNVVANGSGQLIVSFSAPLSSYGNTITGYTATAYPSNITATGVSSPLTISGLTVGVPYTVVVSAVTSIGNGLAYTSGTVVPLVAPSATNNWLRWIYSTSSYSFNHLTAGADGKIYIAGNSAAANTSVTIGNANIQLNPYNGYIAVLDTLGALLSVKRLSGGGYGLNVSHCHVDSSNNLFVTGDTAYDMLIDGVTYVKPTTSTAGFLMKLNSSGAVQLIVWIDGSTTSESYQIRSDVSGNFYATGYTQTGYTNTVFIVGDRLYYNKPNNSSDTAVWVAKFNSSGVNLWTRWFDSTSNDYGIGISVTNNGNVTMTGHTETWSAITSIANGLTAYSTPALGGWFQFINYYNSSGDLLWVKFVDGTNTERAYSCANDSSGNVYALGYTDGTSFVIDGTTYTHSGPNSYLVKINTAGVVQWVRSSWTQSTESFRSLFVAPDDTVYMSGFSNSQSFYLNNYTAITVPGTSSYYYFGYIARFNSAGEVLSVRNAGQYRADYCSLDSVGNIYTLSQWNQTGEFRITNSTGTQTGIYGSFVAGSYALMKFTPTDTLQSSAPTAPLSVVAVTQDGKTTVGFFVPYYNGTSTVTSYTATASPGGATVSGSSSPLTINGLTNGVTYTISVTATNANGTSPAATSTVTPKVSYPPTYEWHLRYPSYNIKNTIARTQESLFVTGYPPDGSFTIGTSTETFNSQGGTTYYYVARMTSSGSLLWKTMLSTPVIAISADSDNNLYAVNEVTYQNLIIGSVTYTKPATSYAFLCKFSASGTVLWVNWLEVNSLQQVINDSSGNVYVSGRKTRSGEAGYIAKYNPSGVLLYSRFIDGVGGEEIYDIAIDSSGNLYALGYSDSTSAILIGNQTLTSTGTTGRAVVVAKMDPNGDRIWSKFLDSDSSDEIGTRMKVDSSGFVYLTGITTGTSFSVEGTVYTRPPFVGTGGGSGASTNYNAAFVARLNSTGDVIWFKYIDQGYSDFPGEVATDGSGNCYALVANDTAGNFYFNIHGDIYLKPIAETGAMFVKFNPSGDVLWIMWLTNVGYGLSVLDLIYDSVEDAFYLSGNSNGPAQLGVGTYLSGVSGTYSFITKLIDGYQKPPSKPRTVTAVGGNQLATVTFTPPTVDGGAAITSYTVTSSPGGRKRTGASSPLTVTGLTNGQTYTFTVRATTIYGNGAVSDPSSSLLIGAPSVPANLLVEGASQSVRIRFNASNGNGSPITSYNINYNPGNVSIQTLSTTTIITGLTNDTAYTFTVSATNAIGTSALTAPAVGYPGSGSYNYFVLYYHGGYSQADVNRMQFYRNTVPFSPITYTVANVTSPSQLGITDVWYSGSGSTLLTPTLQSVAPIGATWTNSNYLTVTSANDGNVIMVLPFYTNVAMSANQVSFIMNLGDGRYRAKYFKLYGGSSAGGAIPGVLYNLYEYGIPTQVGDDIGEYHQGYYYESILNLTQYSTGAFEPEPEAEPEPEPEIEPEPEPEAFTEPEAEPEPEPEPIPPATPGQLDAEINEIAPGQTVDVQGSGSVVDGVYTPAVVYSAIAAAPLDQTITATFESDVTSIVMQNLPADVTKVITGVSSDESNLSTYIFVRFYNSSGTPLSTFDPVTIIIDIPKFRSNVAIMRHILTGEEILGTRIVPGKYQFIITSNPEYQILDEFENGRITKLNLKNAKIQFLTKPAKNGRFLM